MKRLSEAQGQAGLVRRSRPLVLIGLCTADGRRVQAVKDEDQEGLTLSESVI